MKNPLSASGVAIALIAGASLRRPPLTRGRFPSQTFRSHRRSRIRCRVARRSFDYIVGAGGALKCGRRVARNKEKAPHGCGASLRISTANYF